MVKSKSIDTPIDSKSNKMHKFLELIENNYSRNKGVSFYADRLNITPNYLNMLCKKQFGRNAGEMITVRVILEAKRLLFHTSSDISEIAFNLGFEDPFYFMRTFKRIEGKLPTVFRDNIYKKYQRGNN